MAGILYDLEESRRAQPKGANGRSIKVFPVLRQVMSPVGIAIDDAGWYIFRDRGDQAWW